MITVKRKYIYTTVYTVQGLYSGQWEDETEEETYREGKARLREYRANMPEYAHRLKVTTTRTLKQE